MRIQKNERIWFSVRVIGVEAARRMITKDQFIITIENKQVTSHRLT